MKKITIIGMAALVAMGMLGTSCNKAESPEIETPETQKENIVTLTTTVGFGEADTKALDINYTDKKLTKTFAVGEQVVLTYEDQDGNNQNTVSQALTPEDISADGKSAKLTFSLTNPKADGAITYQYPASMLGDNGHVKTSYFYAQNGTLTDVATRDYAGYDGSFAGTNLPASATLDNEIAVVAFTLYKSDGTTDITNTITGMTIEVSGVTYTITPSGLDKIYVAMWPEDGSEITITATDGSKNYTKTLTSKTYALGQFYQQGLKMAEAATDLSTISADYEAKNGETLTGTLGSNVKISIADGATVTLKDVNITNLGDGCDWAGINCPGDATLVLEGTNTVCAGRDGSGYNNYPGIYIAPDNTLTIQGDGTLTAYSVASGPYGAGIGGGYDISCGNIVINSGTITATGGRSAAGIGGGNEANCGNITISGGTITATGGSSAAGIGGGNEANCGNITISGGTIEATGGDGAAGIGGGYENKACGTINITSDVTSVTATKGSDDAPNSIGRGQYGSEITVTIGGTEYASGISQSPYEYPTALNITSPSVGQVIGSDGKNYAADATLPTGVTKVAMIAYVSGTHGLAIALADEGSKMKWNPAVSAAAAHTPAFTGGTWCLPSQDQWKQMFSANGGDEESCSGLNTAIVNAGGTALQEEVDQYWSSSEEDEDLAWYVSLTDGDTLWDNYGKYDGDFYVRACLAF